jgi:SNF2 family DNA or RNA helicase
MLRRTKSRVLSELPSRTETTLRTKPSGEEAAFYEAVCLRAIEKLAEAEYVIHLDPWWNPAVEDQASDHAHRIGQQRPVTIYRIILAGTIEETILELHATKRDLADCLLERADGSGKITT